jgi:hypothetical protein
LQSVDRGLEIAKSEKAHALASAEDFGEGSPVLFGDPRGYFRILGTIE